MVIYKGKDARNVFDDLNLNLNFSCNHIRKEIVACKVSKKTQSIYFFMKNIGEFMEIKRGEGHSDCAGMGLHLPNKNIKNLTDNMFYMQNRISKYLGKWVNKYPQYY